MTKSWADYKREARDRAKAASKTMPDAADPYLRTSFSNFFTADVQHDGGDWSSVEQTFGNAGVPLPGFETDDWPEHETFGLVQMDIEDRRSLGRAEMLANAMTDGLRVLTDKINRFKLQETEARIAELEKADLSAPAAQKRALKENVDLNRIKGLLAKNVRLTFPAYEIKG